MIHVRNLHKSFRVHRKEAGLWGSVKSLFFRKWEDRPALTDVSLDIGPGEIVGLIGANGAGKTTLVKLLSGIIHPTSGTAEVLGYRPWERKNDFRRQISLIMGQKAQLWWDLPAGDCFLLLKEIYEIPQADYKRRLDFLTHTLAVGDLLDIQVRRLSLGERMKMELIAALLHQPKVVYLDEPTIGLDIMTQRAIREFLLDYRQSFQPAMLLTSHYMEDIERLCKRIIIISKGELVYDGPLSQVQQEFASHKVITVVLDETPEPGLKPPPENGPATLEQLGLGRCQAEVLAQEPGRLQVKVPRREVPLAAAALLQRLPVLDLSIAEEDISTIIAAMMRREHPATSEATS